VCYEAPNEDMTTRCKCHKIQQQRNFPKRKRKRKFSQKERHVYCEYINK